MDPFERHIKQHFDNKSYSYNELHWQEAQKLIAADKRKRRGWFYWWAGGISAILLVSLAYWTLSAESLLVPVSGNVESSNFAEIIPISSETEQNTAPSIDKNQTSSKFSDPSAVDPSSVESSSISPSSAAKAPQNSSATNIKRSRVRSKGGQLTSKENSAGGIIVPIATDEFNNITKPSAGLAQAKTETGGNTYKPAVIPPDKVQPVNDSDNSGSQQSDPGLTGSELSNSVPEENSVLKPESQIITPETKIVPFRWGFVAGYLMQKRFAEAPLLNGAYLGVRSNWLISPNWSIGADLSFVVQEIESVHFHHDVISGYGFGRDSLVTDMYAKRAITLQIPIAISYALGKHTFTGMIGTRILLDAQARMQKLHYTNANPENTTNGVIIPRSTMVTRKEQLMPQGALSPFSLYTGIRYGWMIGKGWGLETNISVPLYHKTARLDYGARMAADQGIRLELGVMKVF